MKSKSLTNLFHDHFGTASPIWQFTRGGDELVLSISGDTAGPTAQATLSRAQADEIEQLAGETRVLCLDASVLGHDLTLHLLGRKISPTEWAGVAAALSDAEAVAKNSMQALAFAEGVISEVNSAVVVLDRAGTIQRFNHMAEEYTGRREADVIGKNAQELFMSPAEGRASRRNIDRFYEKGQPYDVERSVRTTEGPRRFLFRNKFIAGGSGGETDLVVCSGVEIPEVEPVGDQLTTTSGLPLPPETYYFDVLKRIMDWAAMVDGARALLASVEDGAGDAGSLAHARRIATSAVKDAYALYEEIDSRLTRGGPPER